MQHLASSALRSQFEAGHLAEVFEPVRAEMAEREESIKLIEARAESLEAVRNDLNFDPKLRDEIPDLVITEKDLQQEEKGRAELLDQLQSPLTKNYAEKMTLRYDL